MLPKNTLRRVARRSVAPLLGALLVTAPAVVLASHQFPDVPDTHPFHDDISAIAGAGITAGFSDGTYRPGDPVTRQSMAAFMRRGFGHVVLSAGDPPVTSSVDGGRSGPGEAVVVRQVELAVPGARNSFDPQQFVYLQGRVTFNASMSSGTGCPCEFRVLIREVDGDEAPYEQAQTILAEYTGYHSIDVEALFAAAPGARAFELAVEVTSWNFGSSINPPSFGISAYSSLSAMTFPFSGG